MTIVTISTIEWRICQFFTEFTTLLLCTLRIRNECRMNIGRAIK